MRVGIGLPASVFFPKKQYLPEWAPSAVIEVGKKQLQAEGIAHQKLCLIHYAGGVSSVSMELMEPHPAWDLPLATPRGLLCP